MPATDDLSRVFSALADPTRRQMLTRLAEGSTTVGELGTPFAMSGPAVSQHLRVLERAGLVTRMPRAQWRVVSLRRGPLDEAARWVNAHRREWDERLDRLEARLEDMEGGDDA